MPVAVVRAWKGGADDASPARAQSRPAARSPGGGAARGALTGPAGDASRELVAVPPMPLPRVPGAPPSVSPRARGAPAAGPAAAAAAAATVTGSPAPAPRLRAGAGAVGATEARDPIGDGAPPPPAEEATPGAGRRALALLVLSRSESPRGGGVGGAHAAQRSKWGSVRGRINEVVDQSTTLPPEARLRNSARLGCAAVERGDLTVGVAALTVRRLGSLLRVSGTRDSVIPRVIPRPAH